MAGKDTTDKIKTSHETISASQGTFTEEKVQEVLKTLNDYKAGKASIDAKATENQEWWRLRHWKVIQGENEGTKQGQEVGSSWAVNSILNKHADIMDSFPKPNVLPREADDEEEAKILTKILPVIEEQNNAEEIYSQAGYDMVIDGTAITGVFWDNSKHDGLGDIVKTNVDVHNVFWQPGVDDIQDSKYFFNIAIADIDDVKKAYPDIADRIGHHGYDSGYVEQYVHDDHIDTTRNVDIIDCYYKKVVEKPVFANGEDGSQILVHTIPQVQVHLATIIQGVCVFCSEDAEGYEDGYYAHGKYPFVFRSLFPIKDSPCGFGYLDIMKNPQRDIDRLDQAIIKNAMMIAKKRYWVKKSADIDVKAFADWDEELVEVGSGNLGDAVEPMQVDPMPAFVSNHLANKVDELKETSGNRDFSQGSTASGVTAASAIAALQEAGSKLSRDVNKTLYRAAKEEYELEIELARQFYTEDRTFRIDDGQGGYEFATYSTQNFTNQDVMFPDGTTRHRRAVFDIKVSAEKSSPFSRAAQNETAKELYQLGMFAPENATAALVCIDMMEFEGKEKVKQQIQQNNMVMQQYNQMAQLIVQTMPQMAAQLGLISAEEAVAQAQPMQRGGSDALGRGTAEERAARKSTDTTRTSNARKRARQASEVM